MEQFDTLYTQCRHIEHMHERVWFTKNYYCKNDSNENLDNFSGLYYKGVYACSIIVHTRADQLLLQLLIEHFDTLPTQCRHIEHMHERVWFTKNYYCKNDSNENLDNFSGLYYKGVYACSIIVHTRADQLLLQLLIEHFDTLPTQCRHIEHMHEGVWFPKKYY